jgi:ketosteroid isomerase-like protein
MSQQDVDLFLTAADRLAADDLGGFAELLHADVTSSGVEDWPEPGPHHGADAVVAELGRIMADFEEQRFTQIETVAQGDDWTVIAYRWHVRGSGSQVEIHFDFAVAFRVRDDRLTELHFRRTREPALAVAGLETR